MQTRSHRACEQLPLEKLFFPKKHILPYKTFNQQSSSTKISLPHWRASQGWGLQPPDLGKVIIIFRQKVNFSGKGHQPKMKKNIFLHLLDENTEFIPSSKMKYWKLGILLTNVWG